MNRPSAKRSARNAANGMGDLFGGPELPTELPAGFRYISNVLSSAEEKSLVQQFEKLPLKPFEFHGYQGNRRIYTFGHRYIFAGQEPRADASISDYLRPLTEIASRISGMPATAFEQLMLTEYAPGAGIGWHRDRPTYEDIVAVSFLAPCTLRLRRKVGDDWERRSAHIEPRSVYLLHGPVRNTWQHSIAPMDVLRYSVTLRTFRPGHGSKDQQASAGRRKSPVSFRGAGNRADDAE
jgi:alkylated DNA repair dioxygenase AlkB